MAKSLSRIILHLIFSTKDRKPSLLNITSELNEYIAAVLLESNCPPIQIGGTEDHIHILFALFREQSISEIVKIVKVASSKWIKMKYSHLHEFTWQSGYGVFSVSQSEVDRVIAYISNQSEHHKKVTFQDEFLRFLERHQIQVDHKYLWD